MQGNPVIEHEDDILAGYRLPTTAELMEELHPRPNTPRQRQVKHLLYLVSEVRSAQWLIADYLRSVASSANLVAENAAAAAAGDGGHENDTDDEDLSGEVDRMRRVVQLIAESAERRDTAISALDLAADVYLAMRRSCAAESLSS